ncbi:hypothetical protein K440DRAFT_191693 [Wilcoxina mikolae CBS 423.85]|nr:hypothetical protein K440DRAFT_191693 [Wilcoxina mikolae CBS 423.85]
MTVPISPPRTFDAWSQANGRAQLLPLSVLKDSAIGIDAHHYLQKALTSQLKEPLVSALGGFPFSLKTTIQQDVREEAILCTGRLYQASYSGMGAL